MLLNILGTACNETRKKIHTTESVPSIHIIEVVTGMCRGRKSLLLG